MLGRKTYAADATLAAAPVDFTTNQLAAGELVLGFNVEESEMLIDLEAVLTFSNTVVERTDFTLFVDGTDVATGTNGLACFTPAVAADENTVYVSRTERLAQGYHTVEVRIKAPVGAVTVEGATIPAELVARRHSHPATLGHGVDSKVQLIQ
jgi:hypothetical protein